MGGFEVDTPHLRGYSGQFRSNAAHLGGIGSYQLVSFVVEMTELVSEIFDDAGAVPKVAG